VLVVSCVPLLGFLVWVGGVAIVEPPPENAQVFLVLIPAGVTVAFLARGLYLDAIGRSKKPYDDLPQRPIPRLRARRPTDSE
jgi:hypothetical protein